MHEGRTTHKRAYHSSPCFNMLRSFPKYYSRQHSSNHSDWRLSCSDKFAAAAIPCTALFLDRRERKRERAQLTLYAERHMRWPSRDSRSQPSMVLSVLGSHVSAGLDCLRRFVKTATRHSEALWQTPSVPACESPFGPPLKAPSLSVA